MSLVTPDQIKSEDTESTSATPADIPPLRECILHSVEKYFDHLDGQPTTDLYDMFLAEVEEPLLLAVMKQVSNNQSKAAKLLGLSRGTLRKKLEAYGLLT